MIVITGCARSGTAYASAVLTHLGYDVGHEKLLKDGTASWPIAAGTPTAPYGPSPRATLRLADLVLHQVREPLAAIRSIHTLSEKSWRFIYETTPCRPSDLLLVRSAKYWLHWNLMSERIATRTYKLRELLDELPRLCAALRRPPLRTDVSSVPRANARTSVVKPVEWDDLRRESRDLTDEVAALARRYGYSVPS